ncbi:GIY-YIG nuclease family protein [Frigoribacterium sp. CFBP 8751]|uniref:GIY-YIG nuclease family protein n=1 Tax=Frigoribacterium sp. CFBP 8751 TaxID=2775277 RepID=UPI00177DF445|nr:GIY-YIG nuclease family protein [Frigoribacterium sp. CFBP 8751]MBD8538196.1 GIY-YIG nuclease family protein [Frigoribacterium sp. CFBP 8751]
MTDRSCGRPVDPSSPVPLCDRHLALAADWAASLEGSGEGVTDLLPSPCLACGSRLGVHWPSGWLCAVCEWRHGDVPDGELGVVRIDVVYYIRFDDRIKIGTSSNPRQRLGTLWHDELLAFERGDRLVERRRHGQFAASRFGRTEWFAHSAELDAHVAGLAQGVDDPWQRYARWRSEALALRG